MNILNSLRHRWQAWTGEEETPWDGDAPAWLVSLLVHLVLLIVISLLTFAVPHTLELTLTTAAETLLAETPEEFHFDDQIAPDVGASSASGADIALAAAPELDVMPDIVQQPEIDPLEIGSVQFTEEMELATAPLETSTKLVRGLAGVGVTGASGAIDRITHEILLSLDQRDTLVVWLFDQSGSLQRQRTQIRARLARIYEELGLIDEDLQNLGNQQQPLLTAVMAFGSKTTWAVEQPTADVEAIQKAVASIALDRSGVENVFSAIHQAAERFRKIRSHRNVMLIAVTDEVGDDQRSMLEKTVDVCRRCAMPVYVLGVPAAFGQAETLLKWVDPDQRYDQTPRWGLVNQGPESLMPERLQLPFAGAANETIDSGFGPFALTRLCYQTGGIYFAIHPNRKTSGRVHRRETEPFSSHLSYFFDPQRMRPYRPDYVSIRQYERRVKENAARAAVVQAAKRTTKRLETPTLRFVKRDEAQFAADLTEAQKVAAKLEPNLAMLHTILQRGEEDREKEQMPRWQAAYDLAMGQTLAVLVRTRAYNEMLAKAKRGLNPERESSNTWTLAPDADVSVSSRLARDAEKAKDYLQRVADAHPGTPWALLAQRELSLPMGWTWKESYTPLAQNNQRPQANNNNPRAPRDERRRMLAKPTRRDVPKL